MDADPLGPLDDPTVPELTPTPFEPTPSLTPVLFPTLSAETYPRTSENFLPVVQKAYQDMEIREAIRSQSSDALDRRYDDNLS